MIDNHVPTKSSLEDLTKDEQNKLLRAMKKPEFMGLMNDYMLEISDPKNKEQYDQYLEQLAKEGDLPKGLKLIRPEPEFCMKTSMISKKDKSQTQKLFINICSTKIVNNPDFVWKEEGGKKGQAWSLPYSAGKIRYDQTKKEEVCNTIDVAFHPMAFQYARRYPQFQELICQTGIDAAIKQMGERTEDISKDYTVLQNIKCKGGTPALLTVRIDGKHGRNATEMEKRQGGEGQAPKLYNDLMKQQEGYKENKKKEEKDKKKADELENEEEEEELEQETWDVNEKGEKVIKVPKHKFVYSYPVDYADFLDSTKKERKRPIEIGLNVHLLGVDSVKEVNLDINDQKVVIEVAKKYYLEKQLPYPILSDQGSAKFDSKKKILRIRLKVDQSALPKEEEVHNLTVTREPEEKEEQEELQQNSEIKEEAHQTSTEGQEKQIENPENVLEVKEPENQLHFVKEEESRTFIPNERQDLQIKEAPNKNNKEIQYQKDSDDENEEELLLKQPQANIEEIEPSQEEKQQEEKEKAPLVKNYEHLKFVTQEDSNKFFFIINIPKYQKEGVKYLIFENQVLVKYEDKNKIQYIRIQIENDMNEENSDISMVTDYVVVNIAKTKDHFWEKQGFQVKMDEYEDFKQNFEELMEASKIIKEQQINEKKEKQQQDKNNLEGLSDDDEEDQQQNQEQQLEKEQEEQKDPEEEYRQQLIEKLKKKIENQKNIIQFIDFTQTSQFAYEID